MEIQKDKKSARIAEDVLRLRLSQMLINERCKVGEFKIPIHLAFGHEAIAVAVDTIMQNDDQLVLTHRNAHYNLARLKSLKPGLDEYYLKKEGLAGGELGSMNLTNEGKNIMYTSSILGNNLCVSAGLALGQRVKAKNGVVIVVTGDGAMEEGSFYETLLFLKSYGQSCVIIVENNTYSLATRIDERRCDIDMKKFAESLGVYYEKLEGNDVYAYVERLDKIREYAATNRTPVCVEVLLTTLGSWHLTNEDNPHGKFINYHAGNAPTVNVAESGTAELPIIEWSTEDPVFVLKKHFDEELLKNISANTLNELNEEISE